MYAEINGLEADNYQTLRQVIRSMDRAFMQWVATDMKQRMERDRKTTE